MESSASCVRLDWSDQHARLARDLRVKFMIGSGAHGIDQFDQMRFGIISRERAWLRKGDVLNTRTTKPVAASVAAKRKRADGG